VPRRKDSDPKSPVEPKARLTASGLLELLAREPGPVGWRELLALTGSTDPRTRKALRLLLRGMLRAGELLEDHQGHYHAASVDGTEGVLEARGRGLTFAGVPVERTKRFRLRPGDRVEARVHDESASVLRVVEYSSRPVVGELKYFGRYPHVESLSPEYRGRVSLAEPPAVGEDGNTVAVRITGEDRRGLIGLVTRVVSSKAGAAHASETLLASHGVPVAWPEEVERAAARLPKQVQPGRHRERRSLVDLPLVTIDGETARDFDDAVFAERRRGGWRLVVAIADVAHYVKSGSALDLCAWERGNSVYLP